MFYSSRVKILGTVIRCYPTYADTAKEAAAIPRSEILKDISWFLRPFCSIQWIMFIPEGMLKK